MKTEQWRELQTINPLYEISDQGRLRRKLANGDFNYLTGYDTRSHGNYHAHKINGKKYYTHRLVMLAFEGECPKGHEVDHINRKTLDNRLENLRYVTRKQNVLRGEDKCQSKLTKQKVKAILALASIEGFSLRTIGGMFGVAPQTVHRIIQGKSWSHVER